MNEIDFSNSISGSFIDNCYVISINGNDEDYKHIKICNDTIDKTDNHNLKGVIFDFTNVHVIDSYTVNLFMKTSQAIALMGTSIIWTGFMPGIISSLMDMNIELDNITIGTNIHHGLELINLKSKKHS